MRNIHESIHAYPQHPFVCECVHSHNSHALCAVAGVRWWLRRWRPSSSVCLRLCECVFVCVCRTSRRLRAHVDQRQRTIVIVVVVVVVVDCGRDAAVGASYKTRVGVRCMQCIVNTLLGPTDAARYNATSTSAMFAMGK